MLAVLLALSGTPATLAVAQAAITLEATAAFEGNYLPGRWLPVQVELANDGADKTVMVVAAQEGATTGYMLPIELPGGARKQATLYVAMEQSSTRLNVTVEAAGTLLVRRQLEVRPRPAERLLAVVAPQPPELRLPRRQDLLSYPFVRLDLAAESLPDKAVGLSSLALLMLATPAESLSPVQQDALLGWVFNGGHLVIAGGAEARRVASGLPEALQPALVGDPVELDPGVLGTFVETEGPAQLSGARLTPQPGAQASGPAEAPLWVAAELGQGRVTQLAFAPGAPQMAEWQAAPQFWDQLLRSPRLVNTIFGENPGAAPLQEQVLTGALGYLPSQQLPPSDGLFWLLAIYTLAVGPGVALLLRRFDRQAWSWLAVPVLAAIVATAGYALALGLRSDERIITQISLVEQITPQQSYVRTFAAVLSPRGERLIAQVPPEALVRPLRAGGGPYGRVDGVRGRIEQQATRIRLDIERWLLQGVIAEQQQPFAGLAARIIVDAQGTRAEVDNLSGQTLRDVAVVYAGQVARIGNMAPGAKGVVPWPTGASSPDTGPGALLFPETGNGQGNLPERLNNLRQSMVNSVVERGGIINQGPMALAWLDTSPLALEIEAERAASQHITLLSVPAQINATGQVALPEGWLRLDAEGDGRALCFGSEGRGIVAAPAPVTATLRLPPGLEQLRADALRIELGSEQRWPGSGITTELYDWQRGRWVDINYDGPGDLRLEQAAPFLEAGLVRLRIRGPIEPARCIFVGGTLRGTAP